MTWRNATRAVLTIGWLMLLLPLQTGARCGGISYESGGEGGGCESVALIAAAVVGGVAVAVTAGVVVYRFFAATKAITDLSVGLATHLPAPGGPRTPGGRGGRQVSARPPAWMDPLVRLLPRGDGRSADGRSDDDWAPLTITGTRNNVVVDQNGIPHVIGNPAASAIEKATLRFLNERLAAAGVAFDPRTGNGTYYFPQDENNPLMSKALVQTVDGLLPRGTTADFVKIAFIDNSPVSVDTVECTKTDKNPLELSPGNLDYIEGTILNKMKPRAHNGKEQSQYVVYHARSDAEAAAVANRLRGNRNVRVVNIATGFDTGEIRSPAQERGLSTRPPGGGPGPTPPIVT